jgi:hypothetical protein
MRDAAGGMRLTAYLLSRQKDLKKSSKIGEFIETKGYICKS